jgi:hypothetical protein
MKDKWVEYPEILRHLYQDLELNTRDIGELYSCDSSTVCRYLDKLDIDTRPNWKAGVEAAAKANRVDYVKKRTLPAGYEYWSSRSMGKGKSSELVYVHRLLAVSEYGFEAVRDRHVHHKNKIPWDNRPENIELKTPEEHGQMHGEDYWSRGSSTKS